MKRILSVLCILLVAVASAFADNTMFAKKEGSLYVLWPNPDAASDLGRVEVDLGGNMLGEGDTIVLEGYRSDEKNRAAKLQIAYGDGAYEPVAFVFSNIANGPQPVSECRVVTTAAMAGAKSLKLAVTDDSEAALLVSAFKVKKYIKVPKIVSAEPADGSELEGFKNGDVLSFNTNYDDECGAFYLTFTDNASPATVLYEDWANKVDGKFLFTFYRDLVMYEGHTYTVTAQGYKSTSKYSGTVNGELTLAYKGNTAVPFSDVQLADFSPKSISSADANTVKLTFSAPVTIEKAQVVSESEKQTAVTAIKAVEGSNDKEWEVEIPQTVIEEALLGFNLCAYAVDGEGKKVVNQAGRNNGCVSIDIACSVPHDFTVLPDSKTPYLSLSEFTFEYKDGIKLADAGKTPTLSNGTGTYSGQMVEAGNSLKLVLDNEINTPGKYTLNIPEGTFVLGRGYVSKEMNLEYTVYKEKGEYNVDITPADGAVLNELTSFEITFKEYVEAQVMNNSRFYAELFEEKGNVVCRTSAEAIEGTNRVVITLAQVIRTEGTYTLKIPKSCFLLKGDDILMYDSSEEMEFTFSVVPRAIDYEIPTIVPENKTAVHSLENILIRFEQESPTLHSTAFSVEAVADAPEMKVYQVKVTGEKKDTVETGVTATIGKLPGAGRVNVHLMLSEPIEKAGTYIVTLPKNSLRIKYNSGAEMIYGMNLDFEYTVDPNIEDAVRPFFMDEPETVSVFNMQGQSVGNGKPSEVLGSLKGMYIVNGKKVMIK